MSNQGEKPKEEKKTYKVANMDEISLQLSQMKAAYGLASEDDKPGIQLIIDQLQELVTAYSSPLETGLNNSSNGVVAAEDDEDDEYRLFQAEIAGLSSDNTATSANDLDDSSNSNNDPQGNEDLSSTSETVNNSIGDELEALIGMKCMAPHQERWGQIGFYGAMVSSVLSMERGDTNNDDEPSDLSAIMVRVIFLQPVVKSQLLCPFYKEDKCTYSDQDCKFSHGEVVPLSQLREYNEPDYSSIVPGTRVYAKYHDDLWYKATVKKITDDGECEVSYDVGNEGLKLPLHETCPLTGIENDDAESDLDSSEDDVQNPDLSSDSELEIPKTLLGDGLLDMKGSSALGEWEKYTTGFGSKLMVKMGYVMGTGLGRNREGRVEPVDAIVLPPGKSLDACMELKEKAQDGNLFSAEKRRIKLHRKAEKQRAKLAVQKPKKEATVFEFLNSKLTIRKNQAAPRKDDADLRKQSSSHLNKRLFGLNENMKQVQKDIAKTKQSMKRHKDRDKNTYNVMEKKLEVLEGRRRELNSMQNNVTHEQKLRSDKLLTMADPVKKPLTWSKAYPVYAEKHDMYRVFQELLKELIINKPDDPLLYIRDELPKIAGQLHAPRVFLLGPDPGIIGNSADEFYIHITEGIGLNIASKCGAKYLTLTDIVETAPISIRGVLAQYVTDEEGFDDGLRKLLVATVMKRLARPDCQKNGYVLYGFPQNRLQATCGQQNGLLPRQVFILHPDPEFVPVKRISNSNVEIPTRDPRKSSASVMTQSSNPIAVTRIPSRVTLPELDISKTKEISEVYDFEICKNIPHEKWSTVKKADIETELLVNLISVKPCGSPWIPKILIIGPPLSGKSTVAEEVSQRFGLANVDFISLVRGASRLGDDVAKAAKKYLHDLVPMNEEFVKQILKRRMMKEDCQLKGWVLHGFPDTSLQLRALEVLQLVPNRIFLLSCPEDECLNRLSEKRNEVLSRRMPGLEDRGLPWIDEMHFGSFPYGKTTFRIRYEMFEDNLKNISAHFGKQMMYVDGTQRLATVTKFVEASLLRPPVVRYPIQDGVQPRPSL
ncbi:Zinc finger CCCH-type with G patch domain-containing protein [Orchesella cincta]|uniref:Zinc finger CCCH-type with G patch domain-containing protein n=1 Tax=Orchesella cincta TaxID=48709 RepID=A0A1D2NDI2_ORCCI|nr:Zinc finger CCCH-type with G patch domain-containing protein [Orchesella cincta]